MAPALNAVTPVANNRPDSRPPPKNKQEELQRLEEQNDTYQKRLQELPRQLDEEKQSKQTLEKRQQSTSSKLQQSKASAAEVLRKKSSLEGEKTQLGQNVTGLRRNLERTQEAERLDREATATLIVRLERLRVAHAALATAREDAAAQRPRQAVVEDAMKVVASDANHLSDRHRGDLQLRLERVAKEKSTIQADTTAIEEETARFQEESQRLRGKCNEFTSNIKAMSEKLEASAKEQTVLFTRLEEMQRSTVTALRESMRLKGQQTAMEHDIVESTGRTEALERFYHKEVGYMSPGLQSARALKKQFETSHASRLHECAEALQVPHARRDASLQGACVPGQTSVMEGPSCQAPLLASKKAAGVLPLDRQLAEIVGAAKDIAYGSAGSRSNGSAMKKAGRLVVGEVSATF
eukprot:TRINITY_DN91997_c0_g1_i1.p1 TRINITY_DN91997_c0_g1~~TRINITY_DN91997_c0_g1_i1.p1  ORF type:complete len:409 (+),score=92.55 TRINITY_DN91997_c0_g1_i1:273-1499(+)